MSIDYDELMMIRNEWIEAEEAVKRYEKEAQELFEKYQKALRQYERKKG